MVQQETKVTIRMDSVVKKEFESVLEDLGMNLTTGVNVLARAVIRHGGFPFELSQDAYKNPFNLARIEHSRQQAANGQLIYKTDDELGLNDDV